MTHEPLGIALERQSGQHKFAMLLFLGLPCWQAFSVQLGSLIVTQVIQVLLYLQCLAIQGPQFKISSCCH